MVILRNTTRGVTLLFFLLNHPVPSLLTCVFLFFCSVLWYEILAYLSPPDLPPALQAQLAAQVQVENELNQLFENQRLLAPTLQGAEK